MNGERVTAVFPVRGSWGPVTSDPPEVFRLRQRVSHPAREHLHRVIADRKARGLWPADPDTDPELMDAVNAAHAEAMADSIGGPTYQAAVKLGRERRAKAQAQAVVERHRARKARELQVQRAVLHRERLARDRILNEIRRQRRG